MKKKVFLFILLLFTWQTVYNYLDTNYLETLLGISKKSISYYLIVVPIGWGITVLIVYIIFISFFRSGGKNRK
ncbi:hypothetical protein G3A_18705 [Bacillus sp. 17376]|nr:hypothetical protein G3A_18705 [Bacillus sp. 17376]